MTTSLPSPQILAVQIDVHGRGILEAEDRIRGLIQGLTDGDQHAIDHADETLGWIVDALRGTALLLESVRPYTVTGAARKEAERRIVERELVRLGSQAITEVANLPPLERIRLVEPPHREPFEGEGHDFDWKD